MNKDSIINGNWQTREVSIDGQPLSPKRSQKVRNHSPDGFMWSYGGSGPAQLALAILLMATSKEEASKYYQDFKFDVISRLPKNDFKLNSKEVYDWLWERKKKEL